MRTPSRNTTDELRPEYDLRQLLRRIVRGKYAQRYSAGTNLVLLDPDVHRVFRPDIEGRIRARSLEERIGLAPREKPTLANGDGTPLLAGEVLCIESTHCELGVLGLAVRNTVLVTTDGARTLNRSRHDLIVLD